MGERNLSRNERNWLIAVLDRYGLTLVEAVDPVDGGPIEVLDAAQVMSLVETMLKGAAAAESTRRVQIELTSRDIGTLVRTMEQNLAAELGWSPFGTHTKDLQEGAILEFAGTEPGHLPRWERVRAARVGQIVQHTAKAIARYEVDSEGMVKVPVATFEGLMLEIGYIEDETFQPTEPGFSVDWYPPRGTS